MTLSPAEVARGAWRRWLRDREILLCLAGVFLFLPTLAWLLLVPEPVRPPGATNDQNTALLIGWAGRNLHWIALRVGADLFGNCSILALYLARDHRDVREVLRRAVVALPVFLFAVVASWCLIALGSLAFLVPGLYLYGRLALTGPALLAEPKPGAVGAITRSIALTDRRGWLVFGFMAVPLIGGVIAVRTLAGLSDGLTGVGAGANPVLVTLFAIAAALVTAASGLARVLLQVEIYRRLAAPRHGI